MKDTDIESIRKVLRFRGKSHLADLLRNSTSALEETSSYGSYAFSTLSSFEVYSPIENYEKLKGLCEDDKKAILDAVLAIYPPKAYAPEITAVEFYLDMELSPEYETIDCKALKEDGYDYIREQIEKCEAKIVNKDFDGAITNARTLVESVCLFIVEETGKPYKHDGNLIKLYKEVRGIMRMNPEQYEEDSLKQILSGIISLINGLSSIRNTMSDSHGKPKSKIYKPSYRHAILAVNAAKVVSEFLFTSWKEQKQA